MTMAKFRSKVSKARHGTVSLRTTIPSAVAEMMGLRDGDILLWEVEPKGNTMVVTVFKKRL